jgi:hypothetical protein
MGILDRILRAGEGKKLRALQSLVPDINALESSIKGLSDDALRGKTTEFRDRLAKGETLDDLLIEAFAVCREAATRVIGQRHYDVQLMGGAALHFGWIPEMKTGEGKTLVSTLPSYLNGLSGRGMHLVTVNDYLVRRDSEWMGQIHRFMGLTVGLVVPDDSNTVSKRANYGCDITYGTNNEMGFDYLRDNMATTAAEKVQRGHVYCIVDDHLRQGRRRGEALLQVRVDRSQSEARHRLRGRRRKATGCPAGAGYRSRREGARPGELVRRAAAKSRAPHDGRAEGEGAVQARQGLHRSVGRGEDRR